MMSTDRIAIAILLAAFCDVPQAFADDPSISDDASLNRSLERYRQPPFERGAWHNVCRPDAIADDQPAESADQAMARNVAPYDRARLDSGGWENSLLPSAAAGNPILAAQVGTGVTIPAAVGESASGDELLTRAVSLYTRARLDGGGWENPFVGAPHYAAGNPLLAVRVGEGVTTTTATVRPRLSKNED